MNIGPTLEKPYIGVLFADEIYVEKPYIGVLFADHCSVTKPYICVLFVDEIYVAKPYICVLFADEFYVEKPYIGLLFADQCNIEKPYIVCYLHIIGLWRGTIHFSGICRSHPAPTAVGIIFITHSTYSLKRNIHIYLLVHYKTFSSLIQLRVHCESFSSLIQRRPYILIRNIHIMRLFPTSGIDPT